MSTNNVSPSQSATVAVYRLEHCARSSTFVRTMLVRKKLNVRAYHAHAQEAQRSCVPCSCARSSTFLRTMLMWLVANRLCTASTMPTIPTQQRQTAREFYDVVSRTFAASVCQSLCHPDDPRRAADQCLLTASSYLHGGLRSLSTGKVVIPFSRFSHVTFDESA